MDYSNEEISEDLSPCPMGSSHTTNTTSRLIHSYYDILHSGMYSVDNLRFRLNSSPGNIQKIIDSLDRYDVTDDFIFYNQGRKIGGYRWMWSWRFPASGLNPRIGEKTSVTVGYCLIKGNGATDEGTGFIEFNPAKLDNQGFTLLNYLNMLDVRHTLVKYDLAIDFPINRDKLRISKDGRKYSCEISDSMTEYLGQRNKPGRVKLYDKAAERGYVADLSRVELTCDACWKPSQVLAMLPKVYNYSVGEFPSFQGVTFAFVIALKEICKDRQSLEPWLRLVNPKTRAKIRKAFSTGFTLHYDQAIIENIVKDVSSI